MGVVDVAVTVLKVFLLIAFAIAGTGALCILTSFVAMAVAEAVKFVYRLWPNGAGSDGGDSNDGDDFMELADAVAADHGNDVWEFWEQNVVEEAE